MLRVWFKDIDNEEACTALHYRFSGVSLALRRILDAHYEGAPITGILVFFCSERYLTTYSEPAPTTHAYGGHMSARVAFGFETLDGVGFMEQCQYIFDETSKAIKSIAVNHKRHALLAAIENAVEEVRLHGLDTSYNALRGEVCVEEAILQVEVWIDFLEDAITSRVLVRCMGGIIYEDMIASGKPGYSDFYITTFRKVVVEKGMIVIKGPWDADYLPFKIPVEDVLSHMAP